MYGLTYDDSKIRLLTLDQFGELIEKNPGRVATVIDLEKYQSWKQKLPKPILEESNVKYQSEFASKNGFVFVRY